MNQVSLIFCEIQNQEIFIFLELNYESGNEKPGKKSCSNPISNISKKTKRKSTSEDLKIKKFQDDGLWKCYKSRLKLYYEKLEEEQLIEQEFVNRYDNENDEDNIVTDQVLKGGFKVPIKIWNKLYG